MLAARRRQHTTFCSPERGPEESCWDGRRRPTVGTLIANDTGPLSLHMLHLTKDLMQQLCKAGVCYLHLQIN